MGEEKRSFWDRTSGDLGQLQARLVRPKADGKRLREPGAEKGAHPTGAELISVGTVEGRRRSQRCAASFCTLQGVAARLCA